MSIYQIFPIILLSKLKNIIYYKIEILHYFRFKINYFNIMFIFYCIIDYIDDIFFKNKFDVLVILNYNNEEKFYSKYLELFAYSFLLFTFSLNQLDPCFWN
jgi:hypothetical protein